MGLRRRDPRDLVIEHQAKQINDLLDRLQELIGQIHYHQVQRAAEPAMPDPKRMHVSEDEDDLLYAHRTGQIDKRELEDALSQLGFDNTSIEMEFAN